MYAHVKNTFGKIITFTLILFFVALGVLGILLPIIPGLLFLIIAALIAARHFPALESCLNQNRYSAKCVRISNSFFDMDIWDKTRLCFWGTLKFTLNSAEWTLHFLGRQFKKIF